MHEVVIINGIGRSGKDSFVKLCQKHFANTINMSSVDGVKLIASKMGWENDKSEKGRKFLSDLKVLWDDYNGEATARTFRRVLGYVDFMTDIDLGYLIFVHIREPEKIEEFKQMLKEKNIEPKTLIVTNKNIPEINSNHSDRDVYQYEYDYYIENNDTLDDLEEKAAWFVKELKDA